MIHNVNPIVIEDFCQCRIRINDDSLGQFIAQGKAAPKPEILLENKRKRKQTYELRHNFAIYLSPGL